MTTSSGAACSTTSTTRSRRSSTTCRSRGSKLPDGRRGTRRAARTPRWRCALLGLLTLVAAAPAIAQTARSPEWAAVEDYRAAAASLEREGTAGGVEALLARATSIRDVLLRSEPGRPRFLESLSEDELARLSRDLPGVMLNRVEFLEGEPDPRFFADLAERRGDAADRRFFAALAHTYRTGSWLPAYLERVTDYSACTAFGAGELVSSYRSWSEFRRDCATRYVEAASRELERVSQELVSDCACGDASAVERELADFVTAFPHAPMRDRVEERRAAIAAGTARLRTHCVPG